MALCVQVSRLCKIMVKKKPLASIVRRARGFLYCVAYVCLC